jgi:hypothetical protein
MSMARTRSRAPANFATRIETGGPLPRAALLVVVVGVLFAGCPTDAPALELFADGIDPERVRFEVEDLGRPGRAALVAMKGRGDVDGALFADEAACAGPCRAALVTVLITNKPARADEATADAPPVVRLDAPAGRPRRIPFSYRGLEISPGRIGRIRWLVELWPEEKALVATVSSSVFFDVKEARE